MGIINQDNIINTLTSGTLESLPQTIMLVGERGSGKHAIANIVAKHFNVDIHDISDNVSNDMTSYIQSTTSNAIYVISVNNLNEKEQNSILKFLEEPKNNVHIILLANNTHGIIQTLLNRCISFKLNTYTKDDLKSIVPDCDECVYTYCSTPGQVTSSKNSINTLIKICDTLIDELFNEKFNRVLSNVKELLSNQDNRDNLDIFFKILLDKLYKKYKETVDKVYILLYDIIVMYYDRLNYPKVNQEILLENLVTNLYVEVHRWGSKN